MRSLVEDSPKAKSCAPCSRMSLRQRARRLLPLLLVVAGVGAFKVALTGRLLINLTPSIPRGVYWISPGGTPGRGELVALPIPPRVRELLYERHYLPRSIKLLAKPVAAVEGDHVCIRERRLFIESVDVGAVLDTDRQGRPMPQHPICNDLRSGEVFLATSHDDSFDSRNFGPLPISTLRGTATPILTF